MQPAVQTKIQKQPVTLSEIVPAVRTLPALDKLRLIRILAKELEEAREIFPFEPGKTYDLPTPHNSFGAAAILAEDLVAEQKMNDCLRLNHWCKGR